MVNMNIRKADSVPGDYSIYLSFAYNEVILNKIRALVYRSWHKDTKEWEVPLEDMDKLFNIFASQDIEVTGRYVDLTPKEEITDIDFDFKTTPFAHQRESFLYGHNHNKWFLGDTMGLGKTKQAIDLAVSMKQERGYKHCLILCGVNSLKWNWQNEIATHSDEESLILGQKVKKRTGEIYIGSNKDKLYDVKHLDSISSYFIITNVESLRDNDILSGLVKSVEHGLISMTVIDEAHKCLTNTRSQQGKAILKIQPEYRLAMTGTPLMNTPLDLYGVLRWLGVEMHSFYQFKNYYAIMGGYGGYEVVGYKHLEELQSQFNSITLRRLKEEVLDLPEKTYVDEYVDMLAKQAVIYKEVKADIKSNIDLISVSPNPLAEMIRLRQATGYTGVLSSEVQCSAKLDRLIELMEEIKSNNEKAVIFSNWTSMTDAIYEALTSFGFRLAQITGETADNQRQQIVDDFQNGKYDAVLGTTGAMGTGLTMTIATHVIMYDEPWNFALREQAVDRVHRIGQKNNITVHTLLCKGTIDEQIHKLVYKKGKISDALVDNNIDLNKQELVKYLLA